MRPPTNAMNYFYSLAAALLVIDPLVAVAQIKITLPFQRQVPAQMQASTAQNTDAAQFQWREDIRGSIATLRRAYCGQETAGKLGHTYRGVDDLTDDITEGILWNSTPNPSHDPSETAPENANALRRVAQWQDTQLSDLPIAVANYCAIEHLQNVLDVWSQSGIESERSIYPQQMQTGLLHNRLVVNHINRGATQYLTDAMPTAMVCFADDTAIESFLRKIPLQITQRGARLTPTVPKDFRASRLPAVLHETAATLASPCSDWFKAVYFQPYYARAATQHKAIEDIRSIWRASGISEDDQVIWERQSPNTAAAKFSDSEQFFNELNVAVQRQSTALKSSLTFAVPSKGEFEKTADYESRVQKMQTDFDTNLSETTRGVARKLVLVRTDVFNDYLGTPKIIEANYNADSERLKVKIASSRSPFEIIATFPMPPQEAQVVKPTLESKVPHVLLGLTDGSLKVVAAALVTATKVYAGTIEGFTKSQITFGEAAAKQWPKALAARAEVQTQRDNLRQQAEAARIHEEARSNPRLAFALQKAQSGDPRCSAIWSNAVAMARQPSISDSAWNQVVARLETAANRVGCL